MKDYDDEVYSWEDEVNEIMGTMGIIMPVSHKVGHTAEDAPADPHDRWYYDD